jgi:hypothetical protein
MRHQLDEQQDLSPNTVTVGKWVKVTLRNVAGRGDERSHAPWIGPDIQALEDELLDNLLHVQVLICGVTITTT